MIEELQQMPLWNGKICLALWCWWVVCLWLIGVGHSGGFFVVGWWGVCWWVPVGGVSLWLVGGCCCNHTCLPHFKTTLIYCTCASVVLKWGRTCTSVVLKCGHTCTSVVLKCGF